MAMLVGVNIAVIARGVGAALFFLAAATIFLSTAARFLFAAAPQFFFGLRHGGATQQCNARQRDHEPAAKPTTR
jgi:hypothetical protein